MYYSICPLCGANLDPNEKCTCKAEIEKYKNRIADLTKIEKGGQLRLI